MALSSDTVVALQEAKAAVEAWQTEQETRITEQASFLASVRVPASSVSEAVVKSAMESTRTFIDGILAG